MRNNWYKKGLVVSIVVLFVGVTIASGITFKVDSSKTRQTDVSNDELVKIPVGICRVDSVEDYEVSLTQQQVEELENLIERMTITTENDLLDLNSLPEVFIEKMNRERVGKDGSLMSLDVLKDRYEAKLIKEYYEECGTTRKLAEKLNISQTRAARLVKKYLNS